MPVRSLITGGAGFIGSHLSEALLARGEEVYVLDNLSTGSIVNIDHLKSRPGYHYVLDSVHNNSVVAEMVDRCDIVYHLAAAVGVKLIVEDPVNTIETNVHGTETVLQNASKKGKKVLIASTSEVYGKSEQFPFREDQDVVLGPSSKSRWSYACSKLVDEFLALAYLRQKKLPVVIVRLFNTVGPRQTGRYGMVIPTFVRQALLNEPITVYGDGNQSRSFTYVGDVVWALARLAQAPEAIGQIFNIGSGEEITINELASLIKQMTGSKSEIVHIPYGEAYEEGFEDTGRRVPDISRLVAAIGYKPSWNLRGILERVIEHTASELAETTRAVSIAV
ncbi:MAG: GDP-mannose 4,6-dehydratase [Acidobacteria bacterium]|nr:GDP-mannose 4,6-dehydratase [Acidobacteriota bacterium]